MRAMKASALRLISASLQGFMAGSYSALDWGVATGIMLRFGATALNVCPEPKSAPPITELRIDWSMRLARPQNAVVEDAFPPSSPLGGVQASLQPLHATTERRSACGIGAWDVLEMAL